MTRTWASPSPLEYFAALVERDADLPLFEAALCLGQDEYPWLDVGAVQLEADRWARRLQARIPADAGLLHKLQLLNQFFFQDLGFTVNANDYYDPDNSYPHRVMETRRGIPVSLGVLWMELADAIGLPSHGVCFPGHFLVKIQLPIGQAVIDPGTGRSLSAEQLSGMLVQMLPQQAVVPAQALARSAYLRSASGRDVLARMLRNLKTVFETASDWQRLLAVQERLVVLLPDTWVEYRDRGLVHAALGHSSQAVADLECYLVHADEGQDADAIADRIDALRRAV